MRPDDGRIDHLQRDIARAASGNRIHDDIPNAAVGPASELPKDRVPVAKLVWQVAPRNASPHQPEHRIKHAAVIARRTTTFADQERFEIGPLIVRHQPANHDCSPQRAALNQFAILTSTTLSTQPSDRRRPDSSSFQGFCESSGGPSHFLNWAWCTAPRLRLRCVSFVIGRNQMSSESAGSPEFTNTPYVE